MTASIMVIDDERSMLDVIEAMLETENYDVITFEDADQALAHYEKNQIDLVISDIRMKPIDGITVLKKVKEINSEAVVILITAFANAQDGINALKIGAYDYLQKPFKMEKLRSLVSRALKVTRAVARKEIIESTHTKHELCGLVTANQLMIKLFEMVKKAAPSNTTILLQGESGTGKELFSRAIHQHSGRGDSPFLAVNCGALPEQLLESELFGHTKGSFTGAISDKKGLFEAAGKGTIFLDEISSLSLNLQSKLLRVLQEKEFRQVGSVQNKKISCRVIAATNISLESLIEKGTFREDLYYRLNIIPIEIPPLRERPEDITLLMSHFIEKISTGTGLDISPAALNTMLSYHWPGNVRELENIIERLFTLCHDKTVVQEDLPQYIRDASPFTSLSTTHILPLKKFISMAEGQYIKETIERLNDNVSLAAEKLDIDTQTLKKKLNNFEKATRT